MNKEITFDNCIKFIYNHLDSCDKLFLYSYDDVHIIKLYTNNYAELCRISFNLADKNISLFKRFSMEKGFNVNDYEYVFNHNFTVEEERTLSRLILDVKDKIEQDAKSYFLSILE